MRRRTLLLGVGIAAAGTALIGPGGRFASAQNADMEVTDTDYVIGSPDAPVTMIEFASFTCPHCAAFHNETLPQIKTDYIDTGIVRMVFRHFPLNGLDLQAGMMATCLGPDVYLRTTDVLFSTQQEWLGAQNQLGALSDIGRMAGLTDEAFSQCVNDQELAQQIVERRQHAIDTFNVQSTPTFVINGEVLSGNRPYDFWVETFDRMAGS
ncbi:MAG: DsbA family protein [Pseudomonadota bacterium]